MERRYTDGLSASECKIFGKKTLYQQRTMLPQLFTMVINPKYILRDFSYSKLHVFNSKKVPLLVHGVNHQPGGEALKTMFKNGDDLRQDILTLQLLSIMDRIWLANDLDLKMTPYKTIGTDCEQGYLEFVGDCATLAEI